MVKRLLLLVVLALAVLPIQPFQTADGAIGLGASRAEATTLLVRKPKILRRTLYTFGALTAAGTALTVADKCSKDPACRMKQQAFRDKAHDLWDTGRERLTAPRHRSWDNDNVPDMGDPSLYIPAPKDGLKGFKGATRARPKSANQGGKLRARWDLPGGDIGEWDSQHGELEVYDKRGRHKGVYDPDTGKQIKPAVPGRRTNT